MWDADYLTEWDKTNTCNLKLTEIFWLFERVLKCPDN